MESTMPDWLSSLSAMSQEELLAMAPPQATRAEIEERFPEIREVRVHSIDIAAADGVTVRVRSYRVGERPARDALMWVHGGGFVFGDLDMPEADWVAHMLAARGVPVLSVDYRMCLNGVHFPAPSDDVLTAWQWLVANPEILGTTADRIHLGGASAGGNLVAGVSKRLRDSGLQQPCSLLLVYPLVHGELPEPSAELAKILPEESWLSPERVRDLALNFAGSAAALEDPYAFASNGDVSGQPAVFILNSEVDTLRSSGEAYAAQLHDAGVDVTVTYEPGTEHGHLSEPLLPAALTSIERMAKWMSNQPAPAAEHVSNEA